jgi:hypothetical protein
MGAFLVAAGSHRTGFDPPDQQSDFDAADLPVA